jgi:hypothetical protein
MDHRFCLRTHTRVKPLALSFALAFAGAIASPNSDALPNSSELDAAIPKGLSPVDRDVFRKQLERVASHTPPPLPTNSIPVTNCDDSGSGSLRDAVNNAADGDTIDLTALDCSTITLTSGAISIGLDNLTIQGPNALGLTIDGGYNDRVFWHLGSGTLTISDVSVAHGRKYLLDGDTGNAAGGCVFSEGQVAFEYSWAKYCKAGSNDATASIRGGAIYAQTGAFIDESMVTNSKAYSVGFTRASGGGVYTPGGLIVMDSTISGNYATTTGGGIQVGSGQGGGTAGAYARIKYSSILSNTQSPTGLVLGGGGLYLTGNAYIAHSTIAGNYGCRGGGLYLLNAGTTTAPAGIYSSTISGNTGNWCGVNAAAGGVQSWNQDIVMMDSTVAFNTFLDNQTSTKYGAGIRMANANTVELENTIIAGNMAEINFTDLEPDDIGGASGASVSGANNLVYFTDIVLPGGTILLTDPSLRALDANGGSTATHMPNFGSPVIDVGNNVSGATVDQRGSGFARILGPAPDIGAVEFDLADEIFANGFD